MNLADYAIFLIAFAAAAALPGPEIAALLSRSLAGGVTSSLPLALGLIIGKAIMLSAAVLGLGALLALMGPAFGALKFAGAAYLLWIGVNRLRNAGKLLAAEEAGAAARPLAEVGLGVALTTSNPLALAFYMALLPAVMDMAGVTLVGYFLLLAIVVCVTLAVALGYGLVGEVCRKLFQSRQAKANVDRAAAAIMIGAAMLVALR